MNKKLEEAKKKCKTMVKVFRNCIPEEEPDNIDLAETIETVLNYIEKQDKEIQKKDKRLKKQFNLLTQKDNTIFNMASYIASLDIEEDICENTGRLDECDRMAYGECENCIIEYFKKKKEY